MWDVVLKIELDEYDAVPSSWILESRKEARYPLLTPAAVRKMAANGEPVECKYEVIQVKVVKGNYTTFDAAYDDCVRFTHGRRSRSSSEREPKGKGHRKRKTKRRYSESESDSTSNDDEKENQRSKRKSSTKNSSDEEDETSASSEEEKRSRKSKSKRKRKSVKSSSDEEDASCDDFNVPQSQKKIASKVFIENHLNQTKNLPLPLPPPKSSNEASKKQLTKPQHVSSNRSLDERHVTKSDENLSKKQSLEAYESCNKYHSSQTVNPAKPSSANSSSTDEQDNKFNQRRSPAFLAVDKNSPVGLETPRKQDHLTSPKSQQSVKKQLFSTKTRRHCKEGKKKKHPCAFRLSCSGEEAIMHTLCSMGVYICDMNHRLKKSGTLNSDSSSQKKENEFEEIEMPEDIKVILPFKEKQSFYEFEEKLKMDKEFFDMLVKVYCWKHKNDANITATARGIAKDILTEQQLASYSLKGGHSNKGGKKLAFNKLRIYDLILVVVKRIWSKFWSEYENETEKTLGPFLTGFNKSQTSQSTT